MDGSLGRGARRRPSMPYPGAGAHDHGLIPFDKLIQRRKSSASYPGLRASARGNCERDSKVGATTMQGKVGEMRQGIGKLGLLVAVVLIMGACGGSGDEQSSTPETEASTETLDVTYPDMAVEGYGFEGVFEPALSFTFRVDKWAVGDEPDTINFLYITEEERTMGPVAATSDPMALTFSNVKEVFDPSKPDEKVPISAPEDMVAWFQEHPNLEVGEPVPVTVGGVAGTQLDVVVSSVLNDYPEDCPVPCVNAWPRSPQPMSFLFFLGDKGRHIVLDIEGETVIVSIEAPEEKFDEFLPEAQEVLDTVEWKAVP